MINGTCYVLCVTLYMVDLVDRGRSLRRLRCQRRHHRLLEPERLLLLPPLLGHEHCGTLPPSPPSYPPSSSLLLSHLLYSDLLSSAAFSLSCCALHRYALLILALLIFARLCNELLCLVSLCNRYAILCCLARSMLRLCVSG